MYFRFSWKVSIIGLLLIAAMLRLSYWQWQRHQYKLGLIQNMRSRLELPISDLKTLTPPSEAGWTDLIFRKVHVSGDYDFQHEMLLRNRKYKSVMGLHVLTPLKLESSDLYVLVDRGFVPQSMAELEKRKAFQKPAHFEFVGLIKESVPRRFLAPEDPPSGAGLPWVERWLRVDLSNIQKQLPYKMLPIFLEIVETSDNKALEQSIVDSSTSERDDMFFLSERQPLSQLGNEDVGNGDYPIAVFDTVIPPGRHLGYVFEWALMALMTATICLILQLKRPRTLQRAAGAA